MCPGFPPPQAVRVTVASGEKGFWVVWYNSDMVKLRTAFLAQPKAQKVSLKDGHAPPSVRPSSVRRLSTISKIFSSDTAWSIKAKLHVEHF